jgi:Peptidase C10 family/Spi protease inhibitor/Secretion system C-terminal sorting domain
MRKIKFLIVAFLVGIASANANPVDVNSAQKVAENFYSSTHSSAASGISLAYTERDALGQAVYYVFDVTASAKGFIIVAAEDAAHPIIGYSDEGAFVIPDASNSNNIYFWLQKRKSEVIAMRTHNIAATSNITTEWSSYASNANHAIHAASALTSVGPLCKTYWNQSPYYNAYCPGGSVTGCVATAMAQILKYWAYPSVGIGSHCYSDNEASGFSENYGQLCAEFDTSHYIWSAMSINPLADTNIQIAKLMYDCGVSVDMDYTPSGSGAQVMYGDPSAFYAFTTYFGYDANTINTEYYDPSMDSSWIALLENELNNNRPMQFQGFDPNEGGHSWVCDGYNKFGMVHMNWGWGGENNGFYSVDALNPTPFDFNYGIGVIYGIQPPPGALLAVKKVTDNSTDISVYPNPSHGVFNFTMSNNNNAYQLKVYNVLGQQVSTTIITSVNNQINLSTQPKGVYIYKIMTETGSPVSTGRVVVE